MTYLCYLNSAWPCLRRDVFEKLYQRKVRQGESVLEAAEEKVAQ
jgi:hypothetical protein